MIWLSWLITILVTLAVAGWIIYSVGVQCMPGGERPLVEQFDRLGRPLGEAEAPDYHIMPGVRPED